MSHIFEFAVNILDSYLVLDFINKYFGEKEKSRKSRMGFVLIWVISVINLSIFSFNASYEIYSSITQIALNLIYATIYLKGNYGSKIFISTFTMCLVVLVAGFSSFFISQLHDYGIMEIYVRFSRVRLIAILLSKVLFFQITRIILRIKENAKLLLQDILPLLINPMLSIYAIYVLTNISIQYPAIQEEILHVILLIMAFNISTYISFFKLNKSAKMKMDYELLNLQYTCATENAKDIQQMYETVSSMRHDMRNHLLCISTLLQESEGNTDCVESYITGLLDQQSKAHKKFVFSGNKALDAIINIKQTAALQSGITCDIIISHSLSFMAAEDICVLFGNLLDNAIRAEEKTDKKKIKISIQAQMPYVSIVVSNYMDGSILEDNPTLKTTKKEKNHGYGLSNVKKIVKKYNGLIRLMEEGNEFIVDILLLID